MVKHRFELKHFSYHGVTRQMQSHFLAAEPISLGERINSLQQFDLELKLASKMCLKLGIVPMLSIE